MKNLPLLIGTILGTLVMVVGLAFFLSKSSEPKLVDQALLLANARHKKGPDSAKVTIVEFSDLQCPGCRGMHPVVQQILAKHPQDVRLVYRQFPLVTLHKNAQMAAQGAEVAEQQGKFWEYADQMFNSQDEWAELDKDAFMAKLLEYADKLQIDKTQLQQKIESQEVKDLVTKDIADGNKLNVDSTPTFYVNNLKTAAPQLEKTVESLIAEQSK